MSGSSTPRPGVIVLGDINVDISARVPALPAAGEDCLVPQLELHCGGVGANTAAALAHWGISVGLLGAVGADAFGDFALEFLRGQRVDVSGVKRNARATTGLFFIAIQPDGQRTMFGSRGANAELAPLGSAQILDGVCAAHLVGYSFLSDSGAALAEKVLEEVQRRGGWVALDVGMAPSHQIPQRILQATRKVDILFASEAEAQALTGQGEPADAFAALEDHGAREVVLKLGERGCLIRDGGALREVPPFSVQAVDSTGAGDAFAAAFFHARLCGWSRAETALVANAAGAAAATVVGAADAMPAPPEVQRVLSAARFAPPWEAVRNEVLCRLNEEFGLKESADSRGGRHEARA